MYTNIIPNAIPKVQNTAMAESSLTLPPLDNNSIPNAEASANIKAVNTGDIPKYIPKPKPPNELCVIPPVINNILRATTYVSTIPATTDIRIIAIAAFIKNE